MKIIRIARPPTPLSPFTKGEEKAEMCIAGSTKKKIDVGAILMVNWLTSKDEDLEGEMRDACGE